MIKICHMASYNKNIGDNAAIYNIRNWFKTNSSLPVSWSSLDMNEFYSKKNSISFSKDFFKKANKKFDAIFIGGGGLIEGHLYNQNHTGWKLPFNHEILELIDIPLFAIGLGVNYFRGCEHLSGDGKKNLNLLVNKATRFSVRNDGSQEILEKYGIVSREIPDPGLIFHSSSIKQRKVVLKSAFFQPAKNSNPKINHFRGLSIESLNFLNDFCKKCNMAILPHTLKDFRFFGYDVDGEDLICSVNPARFRNLLTEGGYEQSLATYFNYDYSIAMRGHGQLIGCGLNLPGIYLSTQDKVFDFSKKNGLLPYTVDTGDKNWKLELNNKFTMLVKNPDYLSNWYDINEKNIKNFHRIFSNEMREIEKFLK